MSDQQNKPIDGSPMPPPPKGLDTEYLTQDLMHALQRGCLVAVDREAAARGIGRRDAVKFVLELLK